MTQIVLDSRAGRRSRPAAARRQSIDLYRGLALVAMAAYHACWDLNYYGLIEAGIGVDPVWVTAQRSILTAFILLAGASLTLAHPGRINWRSFWKREAILVGAAVAVSAGTWFLFGDALAYFGVLHALALFSLMALPFLVAPLWVGAVTAAVFLFLPLYSSDLFDSRWLSWIGFFRTTPETADLVPVFPWFGVLLVGLLGMRVLREWPAFTWRTSVWPARALAWLGRWSLVVYLLHQPLLFGVITPIANYLQTAEAAKLAAFTQSCTQSCGTSHDAEFCTAYCGCALEMTVRDNLWDGSGTELQQMAELCTAMAR